MDELADAKIIGGNAQSNQHEFWSETRCAQSFGSQSVAKTYSVTLDYKDAKDVYLVTCAGASPTRLGLLHKQTGVSTSCCRFGCMLIVNRRGGSDEVGSSSVAFGAHTTASVLSKLSGDRPLQIYSGNICQKPMSGIGGSKITLPPEIKL